MTFAGQGVDVLDELAALVAQRPELASGVALGTEVLTRVAASDLALASGAYRHGVDVGAWVMDPDGAPPAAYLRGAAVAYPLSLLAQALLWRALWADALGDAIRAGSVVAFARALAGVAGGVAGRGGARGGGLRRAARAASASAPRSRGCTCRRRRAGARRWRRSTACRWRGSAVARRPRRDLALVNTPTRVVGRPVRPRRSTGAARPAAPDRPRPKRRSGGTGSAAARPALRVVAGGGGRAVPLAGAGGAAGGASRRGRRAERGVDLGAGPGVVGGVARSQFVEPVRWDARRRGSIAESGADWVLDLGPGHRRGRLTAENLRGTGVRVLALASPEGRRVLTAPGAAPVERDVTYADLAPQVRLAPRRPAAPGHAYTRPTRSPAGDPRRDDADGGRRGDRRGAQPTRGTWPSSRAAGSRTGARSTLRVEELAALLEPGREVVFNTLLLDRHLWELHISREALLFGARRAGAPFAGLTVSAGCRTSTRRSRCWTGSRPTGCACNAFKPGPPSRSGGCWRSRAPRRITRSPRTSKAAARAGATVGGPGAAARDLPELRRRDNVLVCAGGGIGTPERAADLLCGTWALAHGAGRCRSTRC